MKDNLLGRSIVRFTFMEHADNIRVGNFVAHDKLRSAQEKMITEGIIALEKEGFLFAAAPTGIGKTAASLAAAMISKFLTKNCMLKIICKSPQMVWIQTHKGYIEILLQIFLIYLKLGMTIWQ